MDLKTCQNHALLMNIFRMLPRRRPPIRNEPFGDPSWYPDNSFRSHAILSLLHTLPLPFLYSIGLVSVACCHYPMGGDLGRTGGRSPQNLKWRLRPMHPSPNILRSSAIGCVRKCELSKKKV